MSYKPQALGFLLRTGVVSGRPPVSLICPSYFPVRQGLDVPTRAAYSHSASVGRRTATPSGRETLRQNSWMSAKGTYSTGNRAPLLRDGFLPITASNISWVTGVSDIAKGRVNTTSWGYSSW